MFMHQLFLGLSYLCTSENWAYSLYCAYTEWQIKRSDLFAQGIINLKDFLSLLVTSLSAAVG